MYIFLNGTYKFSNLYLTFIYDYKNTLAGRTKKLKKNNVYDSIRLLITLYQKKILENFLFTEILDI